MFCKRVSTALQEHPRKTCDGCAELTMGKEMSCVGTVKAVPREGPTPFPSIARVARGAVHVTPARNQRLHAIRRIHVMYTLLLTD
jgi:hypothetical protein